MALGILLASTSLSNFPSLGGAGNYLGPSSNSNEISLSSLLSDKHKLDLWSVTSLSIHEHRINKVVMDELVLELLPLLSNKESRLRAEDRTPRPPFLTSACANSA